MSDARLSWLLAAVVIGGTLLAALLAGLIGCGPQQVGGLNEGDCLLLSPGCVITGDLTYLDGWGTELLVHRFTVWPGQPLIVLTPQAAARIPPPTAVVAQPPSAVTTQPDCGPAGCPIPAAPGPAARAGAERE